MLEVMALAHILLITQIGAPVVFALKILSNIATQVGTALTETIAIPVLEAVFFGVHGAAVALLTDYRARKK